MGQKPRLDKQEVEVFPDIRRREYSDCARAARDLHSSVVANIIVHPA
jgi:hypothetical protein